MFPMVHVWRSDKNEEIVSFYLVGPRDGTQVVRSGLTVKALPTEQFCLSLPIVRILHHSS